MDSKAEYCLPPAYQESSTVINGRQFQIKSYAQLTNISTRQHDSASEEPII
jgi:hypothetical protein